MRPPPSLLLRAGSHYGGPAAPSLPLPTPHIRPRRPLASIGAAWTQGLAFPGSVDPSDQKKTACYDIDVEVEEPLKGQMSSFLLSTANQQEISALDSKVGLEPSAATGWGPNGDKRTDTSGQGRGRGREGPALGTWSSARAPFPGTALPGDSREPPATPPPHLSHLSLGRREHVSFYLQIHETIESINQLKIQRDFMLSFSRDPKGYIQDLLRSQSRDLKVKGTSGSAG